MEMAKTGRWKKNGGLNSYTTCKYGSDSNMYSSVNEDLDSKRNDNNKYDSDGEQDCCFVIWNSQTTNEDSIGD